jgi:hypothetical protein
VDRLVADDLQTLCLGLERVVPWCPTNPVVWILMTSLIKEVIYGDNAFIFLVDTIDARTGRPGAGAERRVSDN